MAEFNVQRDQTDVPTAGTTASITAVSSLSSAFEMMSNNRRMSAGPSASTADQEIDDMSASVVLTDTSTLTYGRVTGSSTNTMRCAAEVVEYLGAPGGPNEFIVRGRFTANLNAGVSSTSVSLTGAGVVDHLKCIPIITGIEAADTTDGGARGTALVLVLSTTSATVYVGGSASRVTVSFTLVEFTGSAWTVCRGAAGPVTADSGTITLVTGSNGSSGTTVDIGDWSTACIFGQHAGDLGSDVNQAIADNWPVYTPTAASTTQVDYTYHANHDATANLHMVHVLKHADMAVQRITSTASHTGASNVTIPSTLSSISEAFVLIFRTSSGTGTAYGRGWVNARLTSTSNVEMWVHRNGNAISTAIEVVDLSGITGATPTRRIFIV
jgi:trimeric autotransporter adhesin